MRSKLFLLSDHTNSFSFCNKERTAKKNPISDADERNSAAQVFRDDTKKVDRQHEEAVNITTRKCGGTYCDQRR